MKTPRQINGSPPKLIYFQASSNLLSDFINYPRNTQLFFICEFAHMGRTSQWRLTDCLLIVMQKTVHETDTLSAMTPRKLGNYPKSSYIRPYIPWKNKKPAT